MNSALARKSSLGAAALAGALLLTAACCAREEPEVSSAPLPGEAPYAKKLIARTYNSGFDLGHDTYNGISAASDGRVYYVLSSQSIDIGGQMFCFDPKSRQTRHVADLTEACGEKGKKTIVQGKSHVSFVESDGKLYFSTHIGYYTIIDGMEKLGVPPAGSDYKPYPGGHLLSYDMASGQFEDFGVAPGREGIITFNMDVKRRRLFGLTWPTGRFFRYDMARKDLKDFGPVSGQGEDGKGETFRTVCRSICVDPDDGSAWFTASTGEIFHFNPANDTLAVLPGEDLKKDYFGLYDYTSAGHMGYNWRQTAWHAADHCIYGVHGNSGYLFKFDPQAARVEVIERITALPSRSSGMFDQFSYGYLGFALGPDGDTLYYLTGGPIYANGKRVAGKSSTAMGEAKGLENLHLITYQITKAKYTDHGPVFYANGNRPLYCNSIAIAKTGNVYTLARITENGKTRADLVEIRDPFKK
jgi:hypothetical protein